MCVHREETSIDKSCCACPLPQGWLELGEALLDTDTHAALAALVKVSDKRQCTPWIILRSNAVTLGGGSCLGRIARSAQSQLVTVESTV